MARATEVSVSLFTRRSPRAARRRADWAVCALIVAIAALYRLLLLQTVFAHVDGDQAIVGLMAYHIQAGDRPTFYYGQPYQGSVEAYAAALAFWLWGASEWTLRLPTLLCALLFTGLVYALAVTLYGRRTAVLSALFVALGPSILVNYGTAAGYSYVEAMDCGALLLLLVVRYPDLRRLPTLAALAGGLLAGIGIWLQPLVAEYLAAIAAAYALRLCACWDGTPIANAVALCRAAVVSAAGALIGAAPLLAYNLGHGWETLTFLRHQTPGGDHLAVARHVLTEAMPILLGLVSPTSVAGVFARLVAEHPLRYGTGVAVGAIVLMRLALDPRGLLRRIAALCRAVPEGHERTGSERIGRDGALALLVVSGLAFFVYTGFGGMPWATRLPRYLLPLYTATPLVVDLFLPRRPGRVTRWTAAVALGALLAAGVGTTLSAEPRASIAGLDRLLLAHGDRVAYGSYWLTNRVAFDTRERVIGVPVTEALAPGQERVPGYIVAAARAPYQRTAWVLDAGGPAERALRAVLSRRHISARLTRWENVVVYDRLSRSLHLRGAAL